MQRVFGISLARLPALGRHRRQRSCETLHEAPKEAKSCRDVDVHDGRRKSLPSNDQSMNDGLAATEPKADQYGAKDSQSKRQKK